MVARASVSREFDVDLGFAAEPGAPPRPLARADGEGGRLFSRTAAPAPSTDSSSLARWRCCWRDSRAAAEPAKMTSVADDDRARRHQTPPRRVSGWRGARIGGVVIERPRKRRAPLPPEAATERFHTAPSRSSLYTIASTSASKEASITLADTPTVDQRPPSPSAHSTSTRVTASVPPWNTRTR